MATIDFLPTFASISGAKIPDDRTIDGVNQLDFILGKSKTARTSYIYNPGSASVQTRILQGNAIREGDWKLIGSTRNKNVSLHNLAEEKPEVKNHAKEKPEKASQLRALYSKWAEQVKMKW